MYPDWNVFNTTARRTFAELAYPASVVRRGLISEYLEARQVHVFLLRCEGLTYLQIGRRLGVSTNMARIIHAGAVRRLAWAWRGVLPIGLQL